MELTTSRMHKNLPNVGLSVPFPGGKTQKAKDEDRFYEEYGGPGPIAILAIFKFFSELPKKRQLGRLR